MTKIQSTVITHARAAASAPYQAPGEILSDAALYELCREYGEKALAYRRKFMGLLPEVYKRRLYEKKGFGSIFEFAAKLAGISEEHVSLVLHLEKRFEDTPILRELLVNGEVSVNKLSRVASIATPENQEALANQVKLLPQRALEVFVRDERVLSNPQNDELFLHVHSNLSQNSIQASANFPDTHEPQRVRFSSFPRILNLSEEVQQKLLDLQNKGIDANSLILEFLEKREEKIENKKEKIAEEQHENFIKYNITESRYIPAKIRKLLHEEHGTKCSMPRCNKSWGEIHHTQRFSLTKIHDPRSTVHGSALCESHHRIVHSIDIKSHEFRTR